MEIKNLRNNLLSNSIVYNIKNSVGMETKPRTKLQNLNVFLNGDENSVHFVVEIKFYGIFLTGYNLLANLLS